MQLFFTACAGVGSVLTFFVYWSMRNHTMQIERAYVGFGVWLMDGEPESALSKHLRLGLQLHNFGNTPATIEEVETWYVIGPRIPKGPGYDTNRRIHFDASKPFLVKGGDYVRHRLDFEIPIEKWQHVRVPGNLFEDRGTPEPEEWSLCIAGRVRYRDRFEQSHEAGFGRVFTGVFDREINPRTNIRKRTESLVFVEVPDYNYDKLA